MEIYGISLILNQTVLIKKKYKEELTAIQLQEFKDCYGALTMEEKDVLIILFCDLTGAWTAGSRSLLETIFF